MLFANLRFTTLIEELLIASEGSAGLNEEEEFFLDFTTLLSLKPSKTGAGLFFFSVLSCPLTTDCASVGSITIDSIICAMFWLEKVRGRITWWKVLLYFCLFDPTIGKIGVETTLTFKKSLILSDYFFEAGCCLV